MSVREHRRLPELDQPLRPARGPALLRDVRARVHPGDDPPRPRPGVDAVLVPVRGEPAGTARRLPGEQLEPVPRRVRGDARVRHRVRRRDRRVHDRDPGLLPQAVAVQEGDGRRRADRRRPGRRPGAAPGPVRDRDPGLGLPDPDDAEDRRRAALAPPAVRGHELVRDGRAVPVPDHPGLHQCLRAADPGRPPGLLRRPALTDRFAELRDLLSGPTLDAGRGLLGARLVRDDATGRRVARIVEVEAYIGEDDRASHARFGRTARNAVMFGPPGTAYVYLVYGMHDCLNVVTEPAGRPAAVLIRAVEPIEGGAAMRRARTARARRRGPPTPGRLEQLTEARLASGPGLVAAAFDITRSDTGADLLDAT